MKSLVVNTYYLVQFFTVIVGVIHLELSLAGFANFEQPTIWWFQILKLTLVATFALTTQAKTKLSLFLYGPQLVLDVLYFAMPKSKWDVMILALAYAQVIVAIYGLDIRRKKSRLLKGTGIFPFMGIKNPPSS